MYNLISIIEFRLRSELFFLSPRHGFTSAALFFKQLHACSHPHVLQYETKAICGISPNCSSRASQQGLERGAVSQLQQFNQWQLELGCQRPVSALHTVPTSFQWCQQELPALAPGWRCQWGHHREHALHVWGPHTSKAKGNKICDTEQYVYTYNWLYNTPTLRVQIKHHPRCFHGALLLKIASNVHSTGGFRLCHLAHLWFCGCYSSPGCKN